MMETLKKAIAEWEERVGKKVTAATTHSGVPLKPLYTELDVNGTYFDKVGLPGEYPFTRGVQSTMYLGRPWTMRQYAGFGTPEESNRRYKFLLAEGETGLSVALDLPTQLGLDSDDPEAEAEVGRVGVAIDSLADMEILFDGIPLNQVSTSFTINATAAILLAMYVAVAEKQGVSPTELRGTVQDDLLKEYVARGAWIFPVEPALRLTGDIVEYCVHHIPRWNPISIAGAHMRDAGATPVQEGAYTLADGIAYCTYFQNRGMEVDSFGSRLSFFFYTYHNLFEEVAKYRAMRRLWATIMKERFSARNPEAMKFRFGVVCGGKSLTSAEPFNNSVRVAYGALASVLGGAQSIFTCAYDEAFTIPTEESARTALRTQQILAEETGVTGTIDPLGGSYFIEALTDKFEEGMSHEIARIDQMGGMVAAIQKGLIQREIALKAYQEEKEIQTGKRVVVGVNKYRSGADPAITLHKYDPAYRERQVERLREIRSHRDSTAVREALHGLRRAATGKENTLPYILRAVKAYATLGEISGTLREVFGEFQEPSLF